jgi:hypothetical protein
MTDEEGRPERVSSWEMRAAALVERQVGAHPVAGEVTVDGHTYAIESDSTELRKEPVKTTRRKLTRAERERIYQEAEAKFQADRTDESRQKLQAAFDALRPTSPKRRSKKRPRRIMLRDNYPTDRSRFGQWLWRRVASFEDSDGETGLDLVELATQSGVSLRKLEYLVESTRADGDEIFPKYVRDKMGKRRRAPLYPTDSEIDACIAVCADRGYYFEAGLSGANQLVTFMFLLLEQQKMTADALSRATNIPLKTIESWAARNPKTRKEPTLNDLVACFEELGRPLVPARERNASPLFLHEFAALKLAYSDSADPAPDTRRMKTPTRRS